MKDVLSFYKFFEVADTELLRERLDSLGQELELKGTVLLAKEGLNSTLTGTKGNLERLMVWLVNRYGKFPFKWSLAEETNEVFFRFKVKIKSEIVTMGVGSLEAGCSGESVDSERWNELLLDSDVVVVDARNDYETDIGTFPGAIVPGTKSFRDFPAWADREMDPAENKRVAMFCTGGIRCEKASAYLLNNGFEEVYQLDGGILKYLETVEDDKNFWGGECFVFDQRVSVNSELEQGHYQQCFACRHPLSETDLDSENYEEGVSCSFCFGEKTQERRDQFRQRQKQVRLANERGEKHLGSTRKP